MRYMRHAFAGVHRFIFTLDVTTVRGPLDVLAEAIAAGWNGTSALQATVNVSSSGIIYSLSSSAAVTVGVAPVGSLITINNAGIFYGKPGDGGAGGNTSFSVYPTNGLAGGDGGVALQVSSPIYVNNTGTIAGGGGGGGGGGAARETTSLNSAACGGGGGGGATYTGINGNVGGAGGAAGSPGSGVETPAGPGTAGSNTAGGSGGTIGVSTGGGGVYSYGGFGGDGGTPGAAGSAGTAGLQGDELSSGGTAGQAGHYAVGNSHITWIATGTRLGTVA